MCRHIKTTHKEPEEVTTQQPSKKTVPERISKLQVASKPAMEIQLVTRQSNRNSYVRFILYLHLYLSSDAKTLFHEYKIIIAFSGFL